MNVTDNATLPDLPEKAPDTCCNARTKSGSGYCTHPAGWGTRHRGSGRCKLHGGNAGRPTDIEKSAPVELRPALRGLKAETQAAILASLTADDTRTIRENAAVAEMLTDQFIVATIDDPGQAQTAINCLKICSEIRRSAHQIEYDRRNLISRTQVQALLLTVMSEFNSGVRKAVNRLRDLTPEQRIATAEALNGVAGEVVQSALVSSLTVSGNG